MLDLLDLGSHVLDATTSTISLQQPEEELVSPSTHLRGLGYHCIHTALIAHAALASEYSEAATPLVCILCVSADPSS